MTKTNNPNANYAAYEKDREAKRSAQTVIEVGERSQHTLGPWKVSEIRGIGKTLCVQTDEESLRIICEVNRVRSSVNANARLIATAPELLDIAKAFLVMGEHIDLQQGLPLERIFAANYKALRSAIAKAEGRA